MINFIYKKPLLILLLIVLVGFFLRIYPFEAKPWIVEFSAELPNQVLDLGQGILSGNTSFLSQRFEYPFLLPYLFLFGYGIFYLVGGLFGLFSSAPEFIDYFFFHLNQIYWQGRMLIAVFGALSVPLAYLIVREIFHRRKEKKVILGALFSAWLVAFGLLSVQFSQQIRPHIAIGFFVLLSFYLYLLCLRKKSLSSYLTLAAGCGLAVGTFISGVFTLPFLVLANYFLSWPRNRFRLTDLLKSIFSRRFFLGMAVFLAVALLFYPYVFFGSTGDAFYLQNQGKGLSVSLGHLPFLIIEPGLGFLLILKGLFLQETALGLFLVVFLIIFFVQKNRPAKDDQSRFKRQALAGWWSFAGLYIVSFGLLENGIRYHLLSPLLPFIAVGLGLLFVSVFDSLSRRGKVSFFFVAVLLLFGAAQSSHLVYLMSRPYTGEKASQWIEENISSADLAVVEGALSDLVPDKESVENQIFLTSQSGRRNQFLLSLSPDRYPSESRSILVFSQIAGYKNDNLFEIYDYLKEKKPAYFVIALRLRKDEKNEYLAYQIAQKNGVLIKSFSPFEEARAAQALEFPSAIENPINFWLAEGLGPNIDIYQMNWNND